tara:strand:+ start:99 stop:881 length:783 start_codon:yes stop_codon:yes gene_type:complete
MFEKARKKIIKSKINLDPFPYIFIRNFIDKSFLKKLNKSLPSFKELEGGGVMYQSSSKTKKTILPNSTIYKKLSRNKFFRSTDILFKNLEPTIVKKFEEQIKIYVNKNFQKSKLNYHSSFSIMRKGYKKSSHLDRRDHLISMIFYPETEASKGGEICLDKMKKSQETYDIFPSKNSLISKKYKVINNSCIIILNVPWAYHSVPNYYGNKDRKYFYVVYDFPIKKSGSKISNRKKGFNENDFWKYKVKVKSEKRKKVFLTE